MVQINLIQITYAYIKVILVTQYIFEKPSKMHVTMLASCHCKIVIFKV
jgi:hypothetical protein